jgi:hypothetical protein
MGQFISKDQSKSVHYRIDNEEVKSFQISHNNNLIDLDVNYTYDELDQVIHEFTNHIVFDIEYDPNVDESLKAYKFLLSQMKLDGNQKVEIFEKINLI